MSLSTPKRIALEELLLQREALYASVHAAETEIHRIFGDVYPLPPPPVEVAQPGAKRKSGKSAAAKSTAPKLRPLQDGETAYRVRYQPGAGATHELHTDRKAVEALIQSPLAAEMVQSVETVDISGSVQSILYPT